MYNSLSRIRTNCVTMASHALVPVLALAGCSTPHLKDQTVSVGRSIGAIYTSQVLENLYSRADEPNAIPSHFSFAKGNIHTTNTVTPTATIPIGDQAHQTIVNGALGVTELVGGTPGVSLAVAEGWDQYWDITPEKDPAVLRTLNFVYKCTFGYINDCDKTVQQRLLEPPAPPQTTEAGSTSVACKATYTAVDCSSNQTVPPDAKPVSTVPTKSDLAQMATIFRICAPCFRVRQPNEQCIQPKDVKKGRAVYDSHNWVCLGEYNSVTERILGHEMVISENAYTNDALLDLVILSLQLQSEKAAAAKGTAGT